MQVKHILYSACAVLAFGGSAFAAQEQEGDALQSAREKVISRYVMDLQKADADDITQLFNQGGWVVSTSRGKVIAHDFFHGFLPEIVSAHTSLNQVFLGKANPNRYAARFHFDFKLKNGESGEGEYVDEFVFLDHSSKLQTVYMFENLKFSKKPFLMQTVSISPS